MAVEYEVLGYIGGEPLYAREGQAPSYTPLPPSSVPSPPSSKRIVEEPEAEPGPLEAPALPKIDIKTREGYGAYQELPGKEQFGVLVAASRAGTIEVGEPGFVPAGAEFVGGLNVDWSRSGLTKAEIAKREAGMVALTGRPAEGWGYLTAEQVADQVAAEEAYEARVAAQKHAQEVVAAQRGESYEEQLAEYKAKQAALAKLEETPGVKTTGGYSLAAAFEAGRGADVYAARGLGLFTPEQVLEAQLGQIEISGQARALEKVKPYRTGIEYPWEGQRRPEVGYDLVAALEGGVAASTLRLAGFRREDVVKAEATVGKPPTLEALEIEEFRAPSGEVDWEAFRATGGVTIGAYEEPAGQPWYKDVASFFTGRGPGELAPGTEFLKASIPGFVGGLGKGEYQKQVEAERLQRILTTGRTFGLEPLPEIRIGMPRFMQVAGIVPFTTTGYRWPTLSPSERWMALQSDIARTALIAGTYGALRYAPKPAPVPTVSYAGVTERGFPQPGIATGLPETPLYAIGGKLVPGAPVIEGTLHKFPIGYVSEGPVSWAQLSGTTAIKGTTIFGEMGQATRFFWPGAAYEFRPTISGVISGQLAPAGVLGGPRIPISPEVGPGVGPLYFERTLGPKLTLGFGGPAVTVVEPSTLTMTPGQLARLYPQPAISAISPYIIPAVPSILTLPGPSISPIPRRIWEPSVVPGIVSPIVAPITEPRVVPGVLPAVTPTPSWLPTTIPGLISPATVPTLAPFPPTVTAFEPVPISAPFPYPEPYIPIPEPILVPPPTMVEPPPVPPTEPPPPTEPILPAIPPLWPGWPKLGRGFARGLRAGKVGYREKLWPFPELVLSMPAPLTGVRTERILRKAKKVPYGARIPRRKVGRLKGIRV